MDAFVWDSHVVTGLADVDNQPHGLVALFNDLSQALFTHPGTDQHAEHLLGRLCERLVHYTELHFADEEALMRSVWGRRPAHPGTRGADQQFVQQLTTLWTTRATMAAPAGTFARFLTAWLGLHILGIDPSLARRIGAISRALRHSRPMSANGSPTTTAACRCC